VAAVPLAAQRASLRAANRRDPRALDSAARRLLLIQPGRSGMPIRVTLLDLVSIMSEFTTTEAETIAAVVHMVESGIVELNGTFRGVKFSPDRSRAA
jgi:hypothetical protein